MSHAQYLPFLGPWLVDNLDNLTAIPIFISPGKAEGGKLYLIELAPLLARTVFSLLNYPHSQLVEFTTR